MNIDSIDSLDAKIDAKIRFKGIISYLNSNGLNMKFNDDYLVLDFLKYCKEIVFTEIWPNFESKNHIVYIDKKLNWIWVIETYERRHISPSNFIYRLKCHLKYDETSNVIRHFDMHTLEVFDELGIVVENNKYIYELENI